MTTQSTVTEIKKGAVIHCYISTNKKGTGFAKSIDPKDKYVEKIEIKSENLNRALPGDKVTIEILGKNIVNGNDYGFLGKVLEVTERKQTLYAGHLDKENGQMFFVSHDTKMYVDFIIPNKNLNGGEDKDKVVVSLESWDDAGKSPIGKVEKVLGKKGDSRAEMAAYSLEKGFDIGFPKEVEEESKIIHERGITESDLEGRMDFRSVLTCTIDPYDAKDFDDAISVQYLDGGLIEIGVHIADVSHYLRPGSAMNDEAEKRTTSVYLVDRVVPMLPEVLSNDLCSLVEARERLTMSAVFVMNMNGEVVSERFGKSVIKSDKRFTYEVAQKIIDENFELPTEQQHTAAELETLKSTYEKILKDLNNIAKKLTAQRKKKGALSMETEEVKFKLDENGTPVDVYRKVRFDAHKLVEEYMLLANTRVAMYIHSLGEETHPSVYRVHPTPDPERMMNLATFLYNMGYNAPFKDDKIAQKDLNRVMDEMENDINRSTIQTQIVRSMQKAYYTTENIGHYGLAFEYYTHFTSPIRRYPDVLVHRLLDKYLQGKKSEPQERGRLEALSLRSSEREKDAAEAERSSVKYKQVEYMSARIGQEVTALVSGLSAWGIYLEDEHSKCEGMIKFKDLGTEFFEYDEKKFIVKGSGGTIIRIGDVFKVQVAGADLEEKTIDYKIISKVRSMEPRRV